MTNKSALILAPLFALFFAISEAQAQQTGIAAGYIRDAGIGSHPSVIFSDNFEGTLSAIRNNWNGDGNITIARSTDKPAASGGAASVEVIPTGNRGFLYKNLNQNYNQLYFRYYVRFESTAYHHTGGVIGGYQPMTNWPQGDAGIKGIRPNGDRLIAIALEAGSRVDFYNAWVDMPGPGFQGQYYGRSFIRDFNVPVSQGTWRCFEIMVKMNTATNVKDGELALWIDGTQLVHFRPGSPNGSWDSAGNWVMNSNGAPFEGLLWRDVLTYGLNWVKLLNYDDVGTPDPVFYDDAVVATSYIGPINTGAVDTVPPAPPTNLAIGN